MYRVHPPGCRPDVLRKIRVLGISLEGISSGGQTFVGREFDRVFAGMVCSATFYDWSFCSYGNGDSTC